MKKVYIALMVLLICMPGFGQSQHNQAATVLRIGDRLPQELWSLPLQVVNHPEGKDVLTLGDYKDKLIILDFWATWCSPCVAMLPKQDSLQHIFADKMQIIPVTYQSHEEVSTFMEKFNRRMKYKNGLPKVVEEVELAKAFPHTYLPHYVWIDASGTVRAITGFEDINAEKITAFLNSEQVSLTTKEDPIQLPFDYNQPFLINGNGNNEQALLYHSILTGYTEGLPGGLTIEVDSLGNGRFRFLNSTLFWMYKMAHGGDSIWINENRAEINLKDPQRFNYDPSYGTIRSWNRKYAFCYELLRRETTRKQLFETMIEELDRLFPDIQASMQQREKLCLVLSRIPGAAIPYSRLEKHNTQRDPDGYTLENATLKGFLLDMNMFTLRESPLPLIDETGITAKLDMRLNGVLNNIDVLAAELEKYGFRLTKENRKISVLVIDDKLDKKL